MADLTMAARRKVLALADVVVASCALAEVRPSPGAESSAPARLLSDALTTALGVWRVEASEPEGVAARCFSALCRPYRQLATTGVSAGFMQPLRAEAVAACGWLATTVALLVGGDPANRAEEAARNCLDACVRLHVYTGHLGSDVQRLLEEKVAEHRRNLM